jgi:hypothetical protein
LKTDDNFLPFFRKGKKYPVYPWPRPGIVNMLLVNELYEKTSFFLLNQQTSRQGGPVDPVKLKVFTYELYAMSYQLELFALCANS